MAKNFRRFRKDKCREPQDEGVHVNLSHILHLPYIIKSLDRYCYEHRPLGKHFKRHKTVGITPDRFKRVTSHLTSDRNTLTNTRYSGTPKSCNHNDTTGKWCHSTLF